MMDKPEYVEADLRARIRELEQALDEAPSRERLRELEADCAVHRKSRDEAWARAEKERRLRYAYAERIDGWVRQVAIEQARAEKAETRVAELEAQGARPPTASAPTPTKRREVYTYKDGSTIPVEREAK